MATRLPYYVGENDIYSQIMGQQQAAPRTLADYYPGFTGGYDTGLYQRLRDEAAARAAIQDAYVSGLLDLGGGMGGGSAVGGTDYGLGLIGLGQGLSSLGLTGLGGMIGNVGIGQLGTAEANAAAQAAAAESMAAIAADAAAAADIANALGVADAVGMSGFGDVGGFGGYGAADGVGMSGFGDAGGFGADGGGFGGGDSGGGGFGGGDSGGGGDGGYAKGGKVTLRGLLVDETLPGPDDGYGALQADEYVIKKSTAKKLGYKKLQALNEGKASIKMRKE